MDIERQILIPESDAIPLLRVDGRDIKVLDLGPASRHMLFSPTQASEHYGAGGHVDGSLYADDEVKQVRLEVYLPAHNKFTHFFKRLFRKPIDQAVVTICPLPPDER